MPTFKIRPIYTLILHELDNGKWGKTEWGRAWFTADEAVDPGVRNLLETKINHYLKDERTPSWGKPLLDSALDAIVKNKWADVVAYWGGFVRAVDSNEAYWTIRAFQLYEPKET